MKKFNTLINMIMVFGAGTIITAVVGGLVLAISGILLIVKKGNKSDSMVD